MLFRDRRIDIKKEILHTRRVRIRGFMGRITTLNFSKDQKEAIAWHDGPLLVLGTPGSGKTTVILHRINHLITKYGVIPRQILVITFTRAAALSMEKRYQEMGQGSGGVRFSTFHAFFYWVVRTAYKLPQDAVLSEEEKRQWVKTILIRLSPEYGNNEELLSSVLRQLDRIANDMVELENYFSRDMPAEEFRRLYEELQDRKKREKKLDFNDMQKMCYELLTERKDILGRIREMYPYILVDEYQDTNRIQYEILKLIAHPADNLFAVGDDDQSIYGFRGAKPEIMLGFQKEFPGARVITLGINFRCPSIVTDTSARLIGNNRKRYSKTLCAARKTTEEEWVRIYRVQDEKRENHIIADRIRKAHREGVPYEEIAVLYRTNETPRRLAILLRNQGIPYTMRDTLPNIFRHMAVAPVMDYLYFAIGDRSRARFLRIMNKPVRYIRRDMLKKDPVDLIALTREAKGEHYLEKNLNTLRDDLRRIKSLPPAAAIHYILNAMRLEACLKELFEERNVDADDIPDRLEELIGMAEPYRTIAEFLQFAEAYEQLLQDEQKTSGRKQEGVQLMTLHSAKGLEFQEVHIIECIEGVIPHKKANTPAGREEERRMFYVGMTRAIHRLNLYVPAMLGQKAVRPSPFIDEISDRKDDSDGEEKKDG